MALNSNISFLFAGVCFTKFSKLGKDKCFRFSQKLYYWNILWACMYISFLNTYAVGVTWSIFDWRISIQLWCIYVSNSLHCYSWIKIIPKSAFKIPRTTENCIKVHQNILKALLKWWIEIQNLRCIKYKSITKKE